MPNFEMPPTAESEQPEAKKPTIMEKVKSFTLGRKIKGIENDLEDLTKQEQSILINPQGQMTPEKIEELKLIRAAKEQAQKRLDELKGLPEETAEEEI